MEQQLIERIKKECESDFKMTMRRFKFLKSMPKSMRPIDHLETVVAWQTAIDSFNNNIIK